MITNTSELLLFHTSNLESSNVLRLGTTLQPWHSEHNAVTSHRAASSLVGQESQRILRCLDDTGGLAVHKSTRLATNFSQIMFNLLPHKLETDYDP